MELKLEHADCKWIDDKLFSEKFDDLYFSFEDGLAETKHVFIEGNMLGQRFKSLVDNQGFSIVETGFGSGLNFVATMQAWKEFAPDNAGKLKFYTVEKFPLTADQIQSVLANWVELSEFSATLVAAYPDNQQGKCIIDFPEFNAELIIYFDDIDIMLADIPAEIDAWFFDGFAPEKNPKMWSGNLFRTARLKISKSGTVATYTASGKIKKLFRENGFKIKRLPGFGKKWHMLRATPV